MTGGGPVFRVLVVCSGNVCRSPLSERLLRAKLVEALGPAAGRLVVTSAGTGAVVGSGMDPRAAAVARTFGADPDGFVARALEPGHVAGADLVLGATREHRAAAVRLHPAAHRYAFTLTEFARLAAAVPAADLPAGDVVARGRALVTAAAARRGLHRAARPELDDVTDPHGGQDRVHREVGAAVDAALTVPVDVLAGRGPAVTPPAPAAAEHRAGPRRARRPTGARRAAGSEPGDGAGTGRAAGPDPLDGAGTRRYAGSEPRDGAGSGARRAAGPTGRSGAGRAGPGRRRPAGRGRRARRVGVRVGLGGLALLVLGAGWVALRGMQAQRELVAARVDVAAVRAALVAGDVPAARTALAAARERTARARDLTGDPVWRLAAAPPYAGATVDAVRTVSVAVDDLATGALPALVDAGAALDPARLRPAGDRIAVDALARAAPALTTARADLLATGDRLAAVADRGALFPPVSTAIGDLRAELAGTARTLDGVARASRLAPDLLGAAGTRRYLIVFQNNAEARATGGLVGAYAVVSAREGRLRVERIGSNTDLRSAEDVPVDLGRDFRSAWGADPALWTNANLDANFPNAARIWLALWKRQTGQALDGVVATDPVALGYLLAATGPVTLPGGGVLDAANAARLTMRDVYARSADNAVRDGYLRSVAGAVVTALVSGRGAPRAVLDQLGRAAGERRLMLYSARPAEQREIRSTVLSGVLSGRPGPYAFVAVNNAGGNKMDYYLTRAIRYEAAGCGGPRRTSRLTVTFGNAGPDPARLPEYVAQRLDRAAATRSQSTSDGALVELVSVYGPLRSGVLRATLDGRPLSVTSGRSEGRPVWTFPLVVEHGRERTVVLELSEPAVATAPVVPVQPLVRPAEVTVSAAACR